jgi:hypothetical protein
MSTQAEIENAARQFNELLLFCLEGVTLDPDGVGMRTVIRRFAAIIHRLWGANLLREEILIKRGHVRRVGGEPISLAGLSRQPLLQCDPRILKKLGDEFMQRIDSLTN